MTDLATNGVYDYDFNDVSVKGIINDFGITEYPQIEANGQVHNVLATTGMNDNPQYGQMNTVLIQGANGDTGIVFQGSTGNVVGSENLSMFSEVAVNSVLNTIINTVNPQFFYL